MGRSKLVTVTVTTRRVRPVLSLAARLNGVSWSAQLGKDRGGKVRSRGRSSGNRAPTNKLNKFPPVASARAKGAD